MMEPSDLAQFLRPFVPPGSEVSDALLIQKAGEALEAIQFATKREIAETFAGHDDALAAITALLVTSHLFPAKSAKDVRLLAANELLAPFMGGTAH